MTLPASTIVGAAPSFGKQIRASAVAPLSSNVLSENEVIACALFFSGSLAFPFRSSFCFTFSTSYERLRWARFILEPSPSR